jgi:hypothetical protein
MPAGYVSIHSSQTTKSEDAILTGNYYDDGIERGTAFQIHRRFTVGASATVKFVLDLTAVDSAKTVRTLPLRMNVNEGQVYVDTYKISSYTGGTEIPSINRNEQSGNTAGAVFKQGITSSGTAGDDLRQYIVGTASGFLYPGGGENTGDNPKTWNHSIICFEVDNQENSAVDFELNLNWYET